MRTRVVYSNIVSPLRVSVNPAPRNLRLGFGVSSLDAIISLSNTSQSVVVEPHVGCQIFQNVTQLDQHGVSTTVSLRNVINFISHAHIRNIALQHTRCSTISMKICMKCIHHLDHAIYIKTVMNLT